MGMRVATEFKPTHFTDGQIKIKVNVAPEYFNLNQLARGLCAMDGITRRSYDGGGPLASPDEIHAINRILRMTKKKFKSELRWIAARCAYGDQDWLWEYEINEDVLNRMEKVILHHFPSFAHAWNSPEAV